LGEDIYLILSGFSEVKRNQATVKVLVRPLVVWMWIGGFIIALGTLVCIIPMGKPVHAESYQELHYQAPSAAMLQPEQKLAFHREGRKEHEVK
jgi:hypothetical protein